jgi:hypothetical protein
MRSLHAGRKVTSLLRMPSPQNGLAASTRFEGGTKTIWAGRAALQDAPNDPQWLGNTTVVHVPGKGYGCQVPSRSSGALAP